MSKKVLVVLLLVVVSMSLFGCKKLSNEEIIELTFEAAEGLNQKSDLGDYDLLAPIPYPMVIPDGGSMNGGDDRFDCFPYAGEAFITHFYLHSTTTNVYGISNGQSADSIDAVMKAEGFEKVADDADKVVYEKYDITVSFILNEDKLVIEIRISVINSREAEKTY